ncbi:MAG TPA: hypothetical protein VFR97_10550 [Capillimicrobium sp.]|nr:hypothetical protein [Capillimicrobium sp.]
MMAAAGRPRYVVHLQPGAPRPARGLWWREFRTLKEARAWIDEHPGHAKLLARQRALPLRLPNGMVTSRIVEDKRYWSADAA